MRTAPLLSAVIALGFATVAPLTAQQIHPFARWTPVSPDIPKLSVSGVIVPDSVRQKVGYQHWRGGAIGAGVGAVGGLLLHLMIGYACEDCGSEDVPLARTSLTLAGLGGGFGFLVGLASPKYHWVPRSDSLPAH